MRYALVALFLTLVAPASAKDVTTSGQPICTEKDELQEAILAVLKKDLVWLKTLKSCIFAKPGMKLVTIEEYGDNDDIKVARVRVIGFGTSLVGYTLNIKD